MPALWHIQHHRVVLWCERWWTMMNIVLLDAIEFIQIQWLQHVLWAQPVLNFNSDSNISNSFSSARSSPSRLVRGQRSKTGSGPSATFLPRISLTWVVYGGLIGAFNCQFNDFNIFQYLQNDSTEGLGCRWPILSSKTSAMLWPQLLTTSPKKLGSPSSDIGCCGWLYTVASSVAMRGCYFFYLFLHFSGGLYWLDHAKIQNLPAPKISNWEGPYLALVIQGHAYHKVRSRASLAESKAPQAASQDR